MLLNPVIYPLPMLCTPKITVAIKSQQKQFKHVPHAIITVHIYQGYCNVQSRHVTSNEVLLESHIMFFLWISMENLKLQQSLTWSTAGAKSWKYDSVYKIWTCGELIQMIFWRLYMQTIFVVPIDIYLWNRIKRRDGCTQGWSNAHFVFDFSWNCTKRNGFK